MPAVNNPCNRKPQMTCANPGSEVPRRLVLASGSARRRELLDLLGLDFEVRPADIDETPQPDETPHCYVLRMATEKARGGVAGELLLAADTVVVIDDEILGKPRDAVDARQMLARLSGRQHRVLTGVGLSDPERGLRMAVVEGTQVHFNRLNEGEIEWYVGTGEPLDKAGAYAIQGLASLFVRAIQGCYWNVVGLPLSTTYQLLRRTRCELLSFAHQSPPAELLARLAGQEEEEDSVEGE